MDVQHSCRCCLRRAPDKDLTTPYTHLGTTEIYSDMLKECFEIHLIVDSDDGVGICDVCVGRLRDASDFKLQVQRSQQELRTRLQGALHVRDEEFIIKSELKKEDWKSGDEMLCEELSVKSEVVESEESNEKLLHEEFIINSELKKEDGTSEDEMSCEDSLIKTETELEDGTSEEEGKEIKMESDVNALASIQETTNIREETTLNALPDKSKKLYMRSYFNFIEWQKRNRITSFSENVLLAYFKEISKKFAPSTLCTEYSMIKATLNIYEMKDVSKYSKVHNFLKGLSDGYKAKRTKTFSPSELKTFIEKAPDEVYLSTKPQDVRSRRILALVPPANAASDDEEYYSSEDDGLDGESFQESSDRPSLGSSSVRLRLLSDFDTFDEMEKMNLSPEAHVLQQSVTSPAFMKTTEHSLRRQILQKLPEDISPSTPLLSPTFKCQATETSTPLESTPEALLYLPLSVASTNSPDSSKFTRPQNKKKPKNITKTIKKKNSIQKKRLQKNQLLFKWEMNKPFLHKVNSFERSDQNVSENSREKLSPVDYFEMFLTSDDIEYIVNQTNLYSTQSTGKSINMSIEEFRDFLAIQMLMGIIKLPSYIDYWSQKTRVPAIADVMSLKRYQLVRRYLHFNDNNFDNGDRYYKIRSIVDRIRANCLKMEDEHKFSIDEMMIPYKGKQAGNRRQYMQNKLSQLSFKMFVRAGVSGYVYDFILYGGDDTFEGFDLSDADRSLGMGELVVMVLCESIKNKAGATVYFDNFYTSFELLKRMRDNEGILCLGTVRANRLRGAENCLTSDKDLKKQGRGSFCQVVCNKNKISVTKWFDYKAVHVASNFSDAYPVSKVKRYCKEKKQKIDVDYPAIISDYNCHMGGVILADMLVALYRTGYRTQRWYMAIFSQLLDICVNNAWLCWRRDHPADKMRLKPFRMELYSELLKKNRVIREIIPGNDVLNAARIKNPVIPRPPESVRFDKLDHWPMYLARGRCKQCKTGQTSVKCTKCNMHLCMTSKRNCFYSYHVLV